MPLKDHRPPTVEAVTAFLYDSYAISWDEAEKTAKNATEFLAKAEERGLSARAAAEILAMQQDFPLLDLNEDSLGEGFDEFDKIPVVNYNTADLDDEKEE